jgi:hypothetical protein
MEDSSFSKIIAQLNEKELEHYNKCPSHKKMNTEKMLKDLEFLFELHNKGVKVASPQNVKHISLLDFQQRLKKSGITKVNSVNAVARFYNKYFMRTIDQCRIMYCIYGRKKFRHHFSYLDRVPTSRGSVYVASVDFEGDSNRLELILSPHIFDRYEERLGISKDRLKTIEWFLKESMHLQLNIVNEVDHENGFFLRNVVACIPSGFILGYLFRNVMYLKTYVYMDMFTEEQHRDHHEYWQTIEKSIKEGILPPIV